MISYTIVGSADSKELADVDWVWQQLENRCNKIRRVFSNCDFRIVSKYNKEWEEYISNVCKIYGFKKKLNPTAFTKEGRYIGGYEEMVRELDARFNAKDIALEKRDETSAEVVCVLRAQRAYRDTRLQNEEQAGGIEWQSRRGVYFAS